VGRTFGISLSPLWRAGHQPKRRVKYTMDLRLTAEEKIYNIRFLLIRRGISYLGEGRERSEKEENLTLQETVTRIG